jgi:hypothetical protein
MADQEQGKGEHKPDPLVEALIPDPSEGPPNAVVLHGRLGRSTAEGQWRLYTSDALDEYVELPEAEILHTRDLPDDRGTLVWVPATLELNYVRSQRRGVQAEFLGGPITAAGLGAPTARGARPGMRRALAPSEFGPCASGFGCPSDDFPCVSFPVWSCPRPSVPVWRCPPTVVAWRCPPTGPLTGCPPTSPAAGCPPPTTPAAGCPTPTTPETGCPIPTEEIPCGSVPFFRCPTAPIGCPTNILRCRTNEPACMSEFGCPSVEVCGGLGF